MNTATSLQLLLFGTDGNIYGHVGLRSATCHKPAGLVIISSSSSLHDRAPLVRFSLGGPQCACCRCVTGNSLAITPFRDREIAELKCFIHRGNSVTPVKCADNVSFIQTVFTLQTTHQHIHYINQARLGAPCFREHGITYVTNSRAITALHWLAVACGCWPS